MLYKYHPELVGGLYKRGGVMGEAMGVGTVCRAGLALTVVAVVVAREEGRVDGDGVGDGAAEAVAC